MTPPKPQEQKEPFKPLIVERQDLSLFWRGRAKALRILDGQRSTSDPITLETARIYDECAAELDAALPDAASPPPIHSDERAEFEAWIGDNYDRIRKANGDYMDAEIQQSWLAWQARSARTTDAGAGNGGLEEAAEYHDNAAKEIRAAVDAPNFDGNEYRHLEAIADHEMFAADFRALKDIAAHSAPAALPTLTEEERGQIVVAECLSESPYGSLSHAVIAGSMKQLLAIIDRLTGPAK